MDIQGVDVSHWDGRIEWTQVPNNYKFSFIKASEGGIPPDSQFAPNWSNCRLIKAPYHFWRYNVDDRKQAEAFFGVTGHYVGMPPVADIEDLSAPKMKSDMVYRIKGFLSNIESLFGVQPIVYTGAWWTNDWVGDFSAFASYKMWLADYTYSSTSGPHHFPRGCTKWLFHQYSDKGVVPGIPSRCDLNVFNGTQDDLDALAGLATTPQKPPDGSGTPWERSIDQWARTMGYAGIYP